ncbi:MAG: hypothetical protein U5L05_15330 [Rubrivivax sp.]|nr:hypothetical protein [Rubrivivax sp.]
MGTCMVGGAHPRFRRRDGLDPGPLIGGVTREGGVHAGIASGVMQGPGAEPAGVVDSGESAVAGAVGTLERVQ